MEKIAETINGLQHIGLPTNDLEKTVAFYEGLGFSVAFCCASYFLTWLCVL